MMRIAIVALCLLPALPSQSTLPAPVGETQSVLTAREAHAFACCQQLAAMWGRRAVDDWRTFAATPLPGYRLLRAEPDPQGRLDFVDLERNEQRAFVGGACLTYLVPIEVDDTARHIFCVRGDGVAAFTGNTTGNEERDSASFAPDAALGQGGDRKSVV